MEIKAKLLVKNETASYGANGFRKREFVVEYADNPQYPQFIKFELVQDKCEDLNPYNIGQEINIYFDLKGRKWTNPQGEEVYFNSLQAWRLSAVNDVAATSTPADSATPQADNVADSLTEPKWLSSDSTEADDLPF